MTRTPRNVGEKALLPTGQHPAVAITAAALEDSQRMLRCGWWRPTERIIYWAGVKREGLWVVTTVIKPVAVLTSGSFRTSPAANAAVTEFLVAAGLSFIGQVHTHPGTGVDHSGGDERDAFMPTESSLSLVVPSYGKLGMYPLTICGVHRYEGGTFRRLGTGEVDSTFCITPSVREFS